MDENKNMVIPVTKQFISTLKPFSSILKEHELLEQPYQVKQKEKTPRRLAHNAKKDYPKVAHPTYKKSGNKRIRPLSKQLSEKEIERYLRSMLTAQKKYGSKPLLVKKTYRHKVGRK